MAEELINSPLCPAHKISEIRYVQIFRIKKNEDGKEVLKLIPEEMEPDGDPMEVYRRFGGGTYAARPMLTNGKPGQGTPLSFGGKPKKFDFDADNPDEEEDEDDEEAEEAERKAKEEAERRREEVMARMRAQQMGADGGMGARRPDPMSEVMSKMFEMQMQMQMKQMELAAQKPQDPITQLLLAKFLETSTAPKQSNDLEKDQLIAKIGRLDEQISKMRTELDDRQTRMMTAAYDHAEKLREVHEKYRVQLEAKQSKLEEMRLLADNNMLEAKTAEMLAANIKEGGKSPGMLKQLAESLGPLLPALMPMLQGMMAAQGGPPPGMLPSGGMQGAPPGMDPSMFGGGTMSND